MLDLRRFALFLLAGAFACVAAHAEDYRSELGGLIGRAGLDDTPDADIFSVGGVFYLKPVPTNGLPLAEAAFLNRSSFVTAHWQRFDFDGDSYDVLTAGFGCYIPGTILYGRIGVTKWDKDFGDDTIVGGTFGVTPIAGLLLTTYFTEDGWDPNATAAYVGKMANGHYYAATASVLDPEEDDVDIGLGFDYYLDHTLSVGGAVSSGSDTVSLRAEKFFRPDFAVGGEVFTGDGIYGFGASLKWRF